MGINLGNILGNINQSLGTGLQGYRQQRQDRIQQEKNLELQLGLQDLSRQLGLQDLKEQRGYDAKLLEEQQKYDARLLEEEQEYDAKKQQRAYDVAIGDLHLDAAVMPSLEVFGRTHPGFSPEQLQGLYDAQKNLLAEQKRLANLKAALGGSPESKHNFEARMQREALDVGLAMFNAVKDDPQFHQNMMEFIKEIVGSPNAQRFLDIEKIEDPSDTQKYIDAELVGYVEQLMKDELGKDVSEYMAVPSFRDALLRPFVTGFAGQRGIFTHKAIEEYEKQKREKQAATQENPPVRKPMTDRDYINEAEAKNRQKKERDAKERTRKGISEL